MKIRIEGLRELDRELSRLKTYSAKRVGDRAMEAALQPVAEAARSLASRTNSGDGWNFSESIVVAKKLRKNQRKGLQSEGKHIRTMHVGAWSRLAHLIEFGTAERFHESGKGVGAMPAAPFMRPAWDANRDKVLEILVRALRVELDRALARAARAAAKAAAKA